jgi:hypothetical protein
MTFTSGFTVPLAAAVLALSSASTEVLPHPSLGRGATAPGTPGAGWSPERIKAPKTRAQATRPAPGPPTWWPQSSTTVAARETKPRHAGGFGVMMSRALAIAVLALAAVLCIAGRMMSNHRRRQPHRCPEEFRRVTVM